MVEFFFYKKTSYMLIWTILLAIPKETLPWVKVQNSQNPELSQLQS